MHRYLYKGRVLDRDGRTLDRHWEGRTIAKSAAQARSRLSYQWKCKQNYPVDFYVELRGDLKMTGAIELKGVG